MIKGNIFLVTFKGKLVFFEKKKSLKIAFDQKKIL
jgi:hypothetical protein